MTTQTAPRPTSDRDRATGGTRWIPRLTLGIAAAHTVFAALMFADEWSGILADGLWDSVADADHARVATLWFAVGGVGLAGLGLLARRAVMTTGALPPEFGVIMLAVGVPIAVLVPASGGWLLVAVGVAALATNRAHHEEPGA